MGLFAFLFDRRAKGAPHKKQFRIRPGDIVRLVGPMGGGMISDQITVGGKPVGYMYRQAPNHQADSGWTFMSGAESQSYADDPANWTMCDLNTVANFDRTIIPYLELPVGTRLDRVAGSEEFRPVEKNG